MKKQTAEGEMPSSYSLTYLLAELQDCAEALESNLIDGECCDAVVQEAAAVAKYAMLIADVKTRKSP
jgi:hypothetical protein